MQIIRKITYRKNFLNRKLHSSFEVESLCKFLIFREFGCFFIENIKTCKRNALVANTEQMIVVNNSFDKTDFASFNHTQKPP